MSILAGQENTAPTAPPTAEELIMIEQQRADLDNTRVTSLPLADGWRAPGGRTGHQFPSRPRIGQPGDTSVHLGQLSGGSLAFQLIPRERDVPVPPRWLAVFDSDMVIDRDDGLGDGDLYRQRLRLPTRRRSFSHPNERSLLRESRNINTNANVPSTFRRGGRGGGHIGPDQSRNNNQPRDPLLPPNRPVQAPRGRPVVRAGATTRTPRAVSRESHGDTWSRKLVTNQGEFFNTMQARTGLKVPSLQPESAAQQRQVAQPMQSAKAIPKGLLEAQISQIKNVINLPSSSGEPAQDRSGFVPPHLRLLQKASAEKAKETKDGDIVSLEPPAQNPTTSAIIKMPDLNETGGLPSSWGPKLSNTPPRTEKPVGLRSPSPVRLQTHSASLAEEEKALAWHREFWGLLGRPMYHVLLQDFDDVSQQLTFLSSYYGSHPSEWEEVRKNGPPSPEKIVEITRNRFSEIFELLDKDQQSAKAPERVRDDAIPGHEFNVGPASAPIHEISEDYIQALVGNIKREHKEKELEHREKSTDSRLKVHKAVATEPRKISPLSKFAAELEDEEHQIGFLVETPSRKAASELGESVHALTTEAVVETASRSRRDSDERRQREKKEAMLRIEREFAEKRRKGASLQTDGQQETSPSKTELADLIEFTASEKSIGEGVPISNIRSSGLLEARKKVSDLMLREAFESQSLIDSSLLKVSQNHEVHQEAGNEVDKDDDQYNAEDIIRGLPKMESSQLSVQRAANRKRFHLLSDKEPWDMNVRLDAQMPDESPVIVHLKCTDDMPYSFVNGLRQVIGVEAWPEVIKHRDFRQVVMETTKKFYGKMAAKWGQQFAYGLGK